jgi:hypothetical protein
MGVAVFFSLIHRWSFEAIIKPMLSDHGGLCMLLLRYFFCLPSHQQKMPTVNVKRVTSLVSVAVLVALVTPCCAKIRRYYIAAVEEDWDYAPGGNLVNTDTA